MDKLDQTYETMEEASAAAKAMTPEEQRELLRRKVDESKKLAERFVTMCRDEKIHPMTACSSVHILSRIFESASPKEFALTGIMLELCTNIDDATKAAKEHADVTKP